MMRQLLAIPFLLGLVLAQPLKDLYPVVRSSLCALQVTCALPADMLYPVDFGRDVRPKLVQAPELVMAGKPAAFQEVWGYLATLFADPLKASSRPKVFVVVPKEERPRLAAWDTPEYRKYVTIVNQSDNDPGALYAQLGFPLLLVDNASVYIPPDGKGSWASLDGPTVAAVVLVARQAVDLARRSKLREEASQ